MGSKPQKLYWVFYEMKRRCYDKSNSHFEYYGGRGITICDEWLTPCNGWKNFRSWALSNGYKVGLTIDRIDNNAEYSPKNCRWVDMFVQANNKSDCHFITYKGKTDTLSNWCKRLGLNYRTTIDRINVRKWSIEKAFEMPVEHKYAKNHFKGVNHGKGVNNQDWFSIINEQDGDNNGTDETDI